MSIGEELRQAREQMGASLLNVENETKIRAKYIIAMENDAFDVLPGKVYVKGFLRIYARFLGLEGEALVSRYDEQFTSQLAEEEANDAQQPVSHDTKLIVPWKGLAVAALTMLLFALIYQGGAMIFNPNDRGQSPGISGTQNNTVDNQGSEPDSNKSDVVPEIKGIDMVLQVTGEKSWMRVVVDNESVFEGTVEPNNVKQFKGREKIWVKFGNAGAVKVRVNGKDYGFLDGPGQVVTRIFTEKDDQQMAGG